MNRLRQLREERNITQEELAFQLNTSQQRISKIERQLVPMGETLIRDCARFFGVTADYLLGISDVQIEIAVSLSNTGGLPDDFLQDILYYYVSFDMSERKLLKEIAKSIANCSYDRDGNQHEDSNMQR